MAKVKLIRQGRTFAPLTPQDDEALARVRTGEVIDCEFSKPRNVKYHRKFFALLNLAYEYWEPEGGLMPESEVNAIIRFAKRANRELGTSITHGMLSAYVEKEIELRADKFPAVAKDFEAFRSWITIEAGYYELKQTPAGIIKTAKSISFASMDDTEFSGLYKSVFAVAWRKMLQSSFESEEAAMAAADMMGEFA